MGGAAAGKALVGGAAAGKPLVGGAVAGEALVGGAVAGEALVGGPKNEPGRASPRRTTNPGGSGSCPNDAAPPC